MTRRSIRGCILAPSLVLALAIGGCGGSRTGDQHGQKLLDRAGFVAELRASFPTYKWPADFRPNIDTVARYSAPGPGSVIPAGGAQLVLGLYSECAWELSWYAAFERGDTRAAAAALKELTDYVPGLQNGVGGGREKAERVARQASLGDPTQALSDAKANCGPNFWKKRP